jgi:hypothetical protein
VEKIDALGNKGTREQQALELWSLLPRAHEIRYYTLADGLETDLLGKVNMCGLTVMKRFGSWGKKFRDKGKTMNGSQSFERAWITI